jgi:plasmid stabilization system protein ParE
MQYVIEWAQPAEAELASIWMAAADQVAVTRAVADLERRLGSHPLRCGKPRTASVNRADFEHPLGIDFTVIEDDKKVIVLAVWYVR